MTRPDWDQALEQDLRRLTEAHARTLWPGPAPGAPPYWNYRLEHTLQVMRYAEKLRRTCGGDREVLRAAVWIHDRAKPLFDGWDHAECAAAWARDHLAELGFPQGKVEAVCFAVRHHVGFRPPRETVPPEAVEARILFDADKLDKYGLHALSYAFFASAAFPHRVVTQRTTAEPLLPMPSDEEAAERFFFPASVRIVRRALARQRWFYRELRRELELDGEEDGDDGETADRGAAHGGRAGPACTEEAP